MKPWLEVCRDAVGDIGAVLAELPTRVEREPVLAQGEGGDDTTAIDAAAETAVVHRLEQLDEDFTLVSEELGERVFGSGKPWRVVCRPDRRLPEREARHPVLLALGRGRGRRTMGDVVFGYVYDFGSGEEWTAERGGGAFLNGVRLGAVEPKDAIEILSFEATTTAQVADKAAAMVGTAYRLRIMGSLALSLCHLAAGRVDAVCSLKPARSVDIAAGQLLVRECGLAIDLFEDPPFEAAPLDLTGVRASSLPEPRSCAGTLAAALTA